MIDRDKKQIKVGIFVAAALLVAMVVIFRLGGEKQLFEFRYSLKTFFSDISGLRVGAPVQLAGLKVGYVNNIKFSPDPANKDIAIDLKVSKKFQSRIRADSVAEVETQGLLGDKFIHVSVGSEDQPMLNDGDLLKSKETASIYDFVQKGGEIIEDLKDASHSASKFFTDMYSSKEDIRETLRSLRNIMKEAETGQGLVHALVYDPKGKTVVADISDSIASLKDIIGKADEEEGKTGAVSGILKNLRSASGDIKDIAGRVNRGEGTIGGLLTDPSVYNDLRTLLGRANRNKLLKAVIRSTLAENDKKIETN